MKLGPIICGVLLVVVWPYKCHQYQSKKKHAQAIQAAEEERNAYLRKTMPLWATPEAVNAYWNPPKTTRLPDENGDAFNVRVEKENPLPYIHVYRLIFDFNTLNFLSRNKEGRRSALDDHWGIYSMDTFNMDQLLALYFFGTNKHYVPGPNPGPDLCGTVADLDINMYYACQYVSLPLDGENSAPSAADLEDIARDTAAEITNKAAADLAVKSMLASHPGTPLSEIKYPHVLAAAGNAYLILTSPNTTRRVTSNSEEEAIAKSHN